MKKIKLLTVVGARPQFIKAAVINRLVREKFADELEEIILHTGQHYDDDMSAVFFRELKIDQPRYNLEVGSKSHGAQTAEIIQGIEEVMEKEKPDYLIVYGDTNSTLAASIAASKTTIPLVHIEAGLRSFDMRMPEEVNRRLTDHVSSLLCCPTQTAVKNLLTEGFEEGSKEWNLSNPEVLFSGDVMLDSVRYYIKEVPVEVKEKFAHIDFGPQAQLWTIHRPSNTDEKNALAGLIGAMKKQLANGKTIIWPLHPRTRGKLTSLLGDGELERLKEEESLFIIDPASYVEVQYLISMVGMVVTDSGGLQKEAYFHERPCVVLRDTTEWKEILESEAAVLAGNDQGKVEESIEHLETRTLDFPTGIFGEGNAGELILEKIKAHHCAHH